MFYSGKFDMGKVALSEHGQKIHPVYVHVNHFQNIF